MAADFQALKVYAGSAQRFLARRFLGSQGQSKTQQPKPKPQEQQQILQPPVFPPPSYPPGLSCMELMMADLEALKLYINYYSTILTTPLPQHYDPDLLARYFASRPHILAFRTIQILFAFVSAVAKMQISKRSQLTADATYSSGNSSNGFDASQYTVGQLLKEMFLDLGPTFVKGQIVKLDRFKTRW
jgi:aarF domain-containing kinase